MNIFIDTSALIKLYFKEEGTQRLKLIFEDNHIEKISISLITVTEFHSAIYKKVRMNVISRQNAEDIISSFNKDQNKYNFLNVNDAVLKLSILLIKKYGENGLRTLDAIQFSTIKIYRDDFVDAVICDDKLFNNLLITEGIDIL